MKIPWVTIARLFQGMMAGVVLLIAIFAVLVIARVDELRDRHNARVRLVMAMEALEDETDQILNSLDDRAAPLPDDRVWARHSYEVEVRLGPLLLEGGSDPEFRDGLLAILKDLGLFRTRLGLITGRDAALLHWRRLAGRLSETTALVRWSIAELSEQLSREWDALYVLIYAALGLCLAVLILLGISMARSNRLERLRGDLHLAREDLEYRVQARTAALTEANQRLSEEAAHRQRAQRETDRIQEELVQSQKMESLGKLAGGIAHDFNNLMASIRGNTELLLRRLDTVDPRRRYGEDVVHATLRAETLTRQLLAFSRHQPYDPRPVDLAGLIRGFRNLLAPLLGEDVTLEADLKDSIHVVYADPNQVEQILMNLAVNARDAMPDGGRIKLTADKLYLDTTSPEIHPDVETGAYIRLTVEDTGTGIPEEIRSRIFEPFFSTRGPGRGSGLGLSVVYGIVRHHKGWIDVESTSGKGAVFHIHLPASDEIPTPITIQHRDEAPRACSGERVLLVEDEDAVRELAREVLFEAGYEVECAGSLAEARASVDSAPGFDLLFTDMALPDGDGLNLATELQAQDPELKVLLTSGYVDHLARWPLIRRKGYRLLRKPFLIAALQTAVREVLDGES